MTPLTLPQALAMLDLQDRLNTHEDPEWMKKNNHWLRKAWISTGGILEAVEGGGSANDWFADTWCHVLSEWLRNTPGDEDITSSAALLVSTMYDEQFWSKTQQDTLMRHTEIGTLGDAFVHLCAAEVLNVHLFERMMELWNMSWDDMHTQVVREGLIDVFCNGIETEPPGLDIYDWAGEQVSKLMADKNEIDVIEALNALEVAYAPVAARRDAEGG